MIGFKILKQWKQTSVTLFVNLLSVHMGAAFCWLIVGYPVTTMTHLIHSKETKILDMDRGTSSETNIFRRLSFLCALLVLPLTVYLSRRFGRKLALAVSTVPFILSYLIIAATKSSAWIGVAMILGTVACVMQFYLVPVYVHEISSKNIRGVHGVIRTLFMGVGLYLGYQQPHVWMEHMNAICNLILPMLFLIGLKILPESPVWLAQQERTSEARRVLAWLKKDAKSPETTQTNQKLGNIDERSSSPIECTKLFESLDIRKHIGITTAIMIGQAVVQINCMAAYFSPQSTNLVLSLKGVIAINLSIHTVTCLITSVLIERAGRRLLLIISCAGMAISLSLLAGCWTKFLRDYFGNADTLYIVMTVISITYIIFYYLGMGSVPSVIALESFPDNVASYGYAISMTGFWIATWIVAECWKTIVLAVDTQYRFFGQAVICGFLLILACIVTETKTK